MDVSTITYEELKAIPDDNEKKEVLKKLLEMYGNNKGVADHLGVAVVAIVNLVARYVEGKHVGRKAMTEEEKAAKKKEKEVAKAEAKKQEETTNADQEVKDEIHNDKAQDNDIKASHDTYVYDTLSGEDAKTLFSGIANTFLKNMYKIEMRVSKV